MLYELEEENYINKNPSQHLMPEGITKIARYADFLAEINYQIEGIIRKHEVTKLRNYNKETFTFF